MMERACSHRQLDGQNRCRQCSAVFVRVWQEMSAITYVPLIVSLIGTGVLVALLLGRSDTTSNSAGQFLMTLVFAYFLWRSIRGILDLFSRHSTYGGRVERITRRRLMSLFSSGDAQVQLGRQRFNVSDEAMRTLNEGEEALFEHMRWSRTVLAVYKLARR